MNSFKMALGLLTFLKFKKGSLTREESSRALAFFPIVGIISGSILVFIDQALANHVSIFLSNALMLLCLVVLRRGRGFEKFMGISSSVRISNIFFWILKYLFLGFIPGPLRWIAIVFMTTFSSEGIALALKRANSKDWEWEDLLWASFICVFLSVVCGPLGIFVLGMVALLLAFYFRFWGNQFRFLENGLEVCVLLAVIGFHDVVKIISLIQ